MLPVYQSRQIGWLLIILVLTMILAISIATAGDPEEGPPIWFYPMMLLVVLPFSIMTVTVTREYVRIAFLLGVPRRTIRLEDIRSCEPYRTVGIRRFMTRVKPMQGQYKLTGAGGVVIMRTEGIPITVSDPDPEKLAGTVAKVQERQRVLGRK